MAISMSVDKLKIIGFIFEMSEKKTHEISVVLLERFWSAYSVTNISGTRTNAELGQQPPFKWEQYESPNKSNGQMGHAFSTKFTCYFIERISA